jgi:hypothetical protein
MKRIKSSYHQLQVLKMAKLRLRKAIIENCDSELVKTISECVLNVLRGNVTLTASQKKKLKKFEVPLRSLADMRVPLSSKKRLLNQRERFIVSLLRTILPTIASLIFLSQNVT